MNRDDAKQLIGMMMRGFPHWKPEDVAGTVDLWHELLQDMPAQQVKAAMLALISEPGRQFAPSIGEVRGKVVYLTARANGLPTAAEAWGEVMRGGGDFIYCTTGDELRRTVAHMRETDDKNYWTAWQTLYNHAATCQSCGERRGFSHPLIEKIARALGWPEQFPGENIEADRAHFIRAFEIEAKRAADDAALPPVVTNYLRLGQQPAQEIKALAERMTKK